MRFLPILLLVAEVAMAQPVVVTQPAPVQPPVVVTPSPAPVVPVGMVPPDRRALASVALNYLRANAATIAPGVDPGEFRQKDMPYSCDVGPKEGSARIGGTFFFERAIAGVPVIGGAVAVTVHGDGTVGGVRNTLPRVGSGTLPRSTTFDPLHPARSFPKKALPDFATILPDARRRAAVIKRGTEVRLPMRIGTQSGLVKATHVIWPTSGGELMSGFLLADGSVYGASVVPATSTDRRIPTVHIDSRTKLPTFISYRRRGGYLVSDAGVIGDPAEIAYRYLEEHPEIFHTGGARCQFEVLSVQSYGPSSRTSFVKLGQIIAGRRVDGAQLVFEIEDGHRVQTIQGHTLGHGNVAILPEITAARARELALAASVSALQNVSADAVSAERNYTPSVELVIFPGELVTQKNAGKAPRTALAYKVEGLMLGLYVDARNGEILYGYSRMPGANIVREAFGTTILSAPGFIEVSRNGVPSPPPGTGLSPDAALAVPILTAVSTFYAGFGWLGTNGRGSDMVVNVNVNMFTCPNAFSPPVVDQSYFCTGEVVPDIVGHELTHGVIWNGSDLTYADESGALNESYADVMGNVIFPEAAGTWFEGEGSAAAIAGLSLRNLQNPAASIPPQPVNYTGYLSRTDLACSPIDAHGLTCDFGGVHLNSGITNRAHVLMSDGGVGVLTGMGRPRVGRLAFDVFTLRLSSWSNMKDAMLATKADCDAILVLGGTLPGSPPFTQLHCDQISPAFATVGIDPDLISDWNPPTAAFAGTIVRDAGATTANGCFITDLTLQMDSPAGLLESQATLVPGGAPLTTSYFGMMTGTIAVTTPPRGGTLKTHTITWTSFFGETPPLRTALTAPAPAGSDNCLGPGVRDEKFSVIGVSTGIPFIGGAGTTTVGNAASAMNVACTLVRTDVQLVDGSGTPIADPGPASTWSTVVWITFVPVTLTRSVTISAAPPGLTPGGPGTFNLATPVAWTYSAGIADTRWQLVFVLTKPPGTTCTP